MAWTLGTAEDHGDVAAVEAAAGRRVARGLPGYLLPLAVLALVVLWITGFAWAPWTLVLLVGALLLRSGLAGLASARLPADGPQFAIDKLREGPVEVVGRVVPPRQALLSPLTSTKCSFFSYRISVPEEAGDGRRVIEERSKLCDFWLKDVTGSIWVISEGLDVRLPKQLDEDLRTFDQTPRAVGEHLRKLGVDPFLSPGVRRAIFIEETRLDPGDNVLVRGHVRRGEDGALVIAQPPGGTLTVERWTRPTFIARPPAGARRNAAIGAAALLVGAGGLLVQLLG